jgi:Stage II sporulation protein
MLPLLPLRRFLRRLRRRVSAFTWFAIGALVLAVVAFATQSEPRGWRLPRPRPTYPTSLPVEVTTALGKMNLEGEYLPGVVDCEIAYFTEDADALGAQAIAARTYVARFLALRGADATVPIGPHFQCWRPVVYERSREAVDRTRGMVIRHDGTLITGNYAAGARARNAKCEPLSPKLHGLPHATWTGVKRAYEKGTRFAGAYWTEIFVTSNAGRRGRDVTATTLGSNTPENRGGLGQHAAICLAERWGATTEKILRHFYGEDIVVSL